MEILQVISRLSFRVAKTMPEIPHEYTVRDEENEAAYVALFHAIGRSRDPVPKGQCGEGAAPLARDHGQAEADSERGEDTDLQRSGRGV